MKSRLVLFLCGLVSLSVASSTAGAVEFSVVNGSSITIPVAGTVQIQVNVANASAQSVAAVGASVFGYNEAVADFQTGTGRATASIFNAICVAPGTCFGGLGQANNAFFSPANLVETVVGGAKRVQIINAANTTPTSQTGANDQGYDGTTSTPDIIFTFRGIAAGSTILQIGTGFQGDGVILGDSSIVQTTPVFFTITVPEPASTLASLAALGTVVVLVGIRRRI